jgi:hypothetical protein
VFVFFSRSFTGWLEPTLAPGCGRALLLPRELGLLEDLPTIQPAPEALQVLRAGPMVRGSPAAVGSQVEVRVRCSGLRATLSSLSAGTAATGKVGVRTLSAAGMYTEVGYNIADQMLYVDRTHCCAQASTVVQRAPLPVWTMVRETPLVLNLFVTI